MIKKWLLLSILLFMLCSLKAQGESPEQDSTLIVGVKESPPFIFREAGEFRGISLRLWESIAQNIDAEYEYREMELQDILTALEAGEIDLAINPLTVTSQRIENFDFTQPFFTSSSAIAAEVRDTNRLLEFVFNFFSLNFLKAVLLLFLVILAFGILAWLFEKRANPEEFPAGWKGVWSGVWWSAVTMTTVGYGDKSPRSPGGRIVALVWMFTAIIIISGFTASIASALTVGQLGSEIQDLSDLRKRKVATVTSSASERFLKNNYIDPDGYATVTEALQALNSDRVDAVVYDEPILRYSLERDSLSNLKVLPYRFNTQYYSFAVPQDSPLRDEIDPVLLQQIENVQWKAVLTEYGLGEF